MLRSCECTPTLHSMGEAVPGQSGRLQPCLPGFVHVPPLVCYESYLPAAIHNLNDLAGRSSMLCRSTPHIVLAERRMEARCRSSR